MAGTGKAHLRDVDDVAAARRGPRRRVPRRPHRASRSTPCRGHQLRRAARRDARPRRRVRLRQEHHRPGDHAAAPPDVGLGPVRGQRATRARTKDMRAARTRMQMIFQDPISSLNPRRKVRDIVMEPLDIWKRGTKQERARGRRPGARGGRHRPAAGRREPAPPVLRRAVPAHLDRPLARARPVADHLRRAGVGARRQRPGPGAQPARGPEGQATA